ncbi:MAG: ATP synthase subunit I [Nitrospiria bacterium]
MIASLFIGGILGALYFYFLKMTAFKGSQRSKATELRSALGGFLLRLTALGLLLYLLGRHTSIDLPWLVLTLVIVFSFFLFQTAAKAFWHEVWHRRTQPMREN